MIASAPTDPVRLRGGTAAGQTLHTHHRVLSTLCSLFYRAHAESRTRPEFPPAPKPPALSVIVWHLLKVSGQDFVRFCLV
ncbi:unnamed protein product [Knipowitschia caucasica]|uniref:Uncharacterized protein n=1 Tax=Knipowitschia caucasica TaxID=637954 RepID=A0AAV2MSZ0_KNICA